MTEALKIPLNNLRIDVDLQGFNIENTGTPQEPYLLGQKRATNALEFGIAMSHPGYNIFVMGDTGTGKLSLIQQHLQNHAEQGQQPTSYAYINNFENAREPLIIRLPMGPGQSFCQDIEKLLDSLLDTFPSAIENPAYQHQKNAIEQNFEQQYLHALEAVEKQASAINIALFHDSTGITFSPVRDNQVLDDDQFTKLSQQDREQFHHQVQVLQKTLAEQLIPLPQWRRESAEKNKKLEQQTLASAIEPLFETLNKSYADHIDILNYLQAMKTDLIVETLQELLLETEDKGMSSSKNKRNTLITKYLPNVVIQHALNVDQPVIYEPHPCYQNIFGRIEYNHDQGNLTTNYRQICPGSLHRANGGFLILDADKLLNYPLVWEALKRAIASKCIEIESVDIESSTAIISLKPAPIPLQVKIILVGTRDIYYLLQEMDDEFNEQFRVLADFDDYIRIDQHSIQQFAKLAIKHSQKISTKTLSQAAIADLVIHSCRLAEHQNRLSARINETLEIITEAVFISSQEQATTIEQNHIQAAINARNQRNGRISETLLEEMLDGTVLITSSGVAIGKVNGLTVLDMGESSFGAATRISATVHPGSKGVVDIEREADLGQSIHSKGVLILTGYIGHCYAQQFPFSFSASIAIEQSYGYIDGDSASLAELCALISAITQLPVKQNLALTGSINQYGEVQAVGGVNEKIEGFFELCQARKLTGDQGVIIPAANCQNLVLKQAVIKAIEQNLFVIYAVTQVDQALQLLTGLPVGKSDKNGCYPENTLNHRIISRLKIISDISAEKDEHETQESDDNQHQKKQS